MPHSSGRWSAFFVLQALHAVTTFVHVLRPPRESGTTWSRVRASRGRSWTDGRPQYWQVYRSRAKRKVFVTWRRNRRGT